MVQIRLNHGVWNYGPEKSLARPGGFGTVFGGADGEPVAVKQLEIDAVVGIDR